MYSCTVLQGSLLTALTAMPCAQHSLCQFKQMIAALPIVLPLQCMTALATWGMSVSAWLTSWLLWTATSPALGHDAAGLQCELEKQWEQREVGIVRGILDLRDGIAGTERCTCASLLVRTVCSSRSSRSSPHDPQCPCSPQRFAWQLICSRGRSWTREWGAQECH